MLRLQYIKDCLTVNQSTTTFTLDTSSISWIINISDDTFASKPNRHFTFTTLPLDKSTTFFFTSSSHRPGMKMLTYDATSFLTKDVLMGVRQPM
jgi:hypothetical protein